MSQKTTVIQSATGDKTALLLTSSATLITGIVVAFYTGWQLTLTMIAVAPFVTWIMNVMIKNIMKYYITNHTSYIKAGALVEQALNSIRTVLAFNRVKFEE